MRTGARLLAGISYASIAAILAAIIVISIAVFLFYSNFYGGSRGVVTQTSPGLLLQL